jgi:hypothetical protein
MPVLLAAAGGNGVASGGHSPRGTVRFLSTPVTTVNNVIA